ncbi:MAG: anti-sigma factor family protein [Phycisphaerales bacterium JB038]
MAERTDHNPNEHQLWRRYAEGLGPLSEPCPTELELAAYLDGRLPSAETAWMEGHLALCPTCVETVLEMRTLSGDEAAAFIAPAESLERARALVRDPGPQREMYRAAVRHWLGPNWALWGQRAAAAVAGLALCVVGYRVGSTPSAAGLQAEHEKALLTQVSFGLYGVDEGVDENLLPLELEVETP